MGPRRGPRPLPPHHGEFTRRLGASARRSTESAQPRRCPARTAPSRAPLTSPSRRLPRPIAPRPPLPLPHFQAGPETRRGGAGRGGRAQAAGAGGPAELQGKRLRGAQRLGGRCWARGWEGKEEPASAWRAPCAPCVRGPGGVPRGAVCGRLLRSPVGYARGCGTCKELRPVLRGSAAVGEWSARESAEEPLG